MKIHSHRGVGAIEFGMSPTEVRVALGTEFESFKRTSESVHPCDYYAGLGCFVYYADATGLMNTMEFCAPAKPTLNGIDLLGISAPTLLRLVKVADPSVSIEADELVSRRLGIGAWYPSMEEEPTTPAESVIVFTQGYYD